MIPYWMSRTQLMLGDEPIETLMSKNVLVVGLGGVGGICAEMIARAGVGKMTIVDITMVEGSRTFFTDGRTGKLSMKYQATTCFNGSLGQAVNKIYPFDY